MEVTLKKAAELSRAAGEAAEKVRIDATQKHSIYAASNPDVPALRAALAGRIDSAMALLQAKYVIRGLIGEANARSGISAALTEREMVDAQTKRLSAIADQFDTARDSTSTPDIAFTEASWMRDRLQRAEKVSHYVETDVSFRVADEDMEATVKARVQRLKRTRSDITDRVAGINLNTRVTLPPSVVSTLKTNGLID